MFKDYYKILQIEKRASREEIKKAYRRLAMEWHPDKNKSQQAHSIFIEINEAYLILYDDDARKRYDFEYNHYHSNVKEESTTHEMDSRRTVFEDEDLSRWANNARQQAEKFATISYEEFMKMLGVVVKEVGTQSATAVVYAISGVVGASAFFSMIEGIRYGDTEQILLSLVFIGACFFGFAYTSKRYKT